MPSMPMGPPPGSFMDAPAPPHFGGVNTMVQAPPVMMEKHHFNTMMQAPQGPSYEMVPEFLERVTEIPRVNIEHRERLVEVPQPQVVDRIVEVPQIQEIIKEEPGDFNEVPVTREAPVIEFNLEK